MRAIWSSIIAILAIGLLIVPATAAGPSTAWTRQFGTSGADEASGVAIDRNRDVYVVGWTEGTLPGQTSKGSIDAFLRKYRPDGRVAWTRQFGTSGPDYGLGVAVDEAGRIYVTGSTLGAFPGQTSRGSDDAFLRKFRPDGRTVWTRQFGTSDTDRGRGIAIDGAGRVYISGVTAGAFPGKTNKGFFDIFLRKFRPDGRTVWTGQFGTSEFEEAQGIAIDDTGRVYIIGQTTGAFPGWTNKGSNDAFLRKIRPNGKTVRTRQFGTSGDDVARGVAIDDADRVYVTGSTGGVFPGQTNKGRADAFLRKYRPNGSTNWTRQFGTSDFDGGYGIAIDRGNRVYVPGQTSGVFPGQTNKGSADAFLRKLRPDGKSNWTRQFGSSQFDRATSCAVDSRLRIAVAGWTYGAIPGKTNEGDKDAYVRVYRQ